MKFTFLILHYMNIEDTIECINSIKRQINDNCYHVIVVDNGSSNNTGKSLQVLFENDLQVDVILNSRNMGFAKGNNLGIHYAKNKINTDFIIMMNNDMILYQSTFLDLISKAYRKDKFHISGPNIISLVDGNKQNPHNSNIKYTKKKLLISLVKYYLFYALNVFYLDKYMHLMLKKLKILLFRKKKKKKIKSKDRNIKLHGSCLIFSPLYLEKYKGIFSGTFLYKEEDILHYISIKENLTMSYISDAVIYHKEDSSTNFIFSSNNKKRKFIYKHQIKSTKEFIKILLDNEVYKNDMLVN